MSVKNIMNKIGMGVAASMLLFTANTSNTAQAAEELTTIKVGYLPVPVRPLFAARAHDLFKKHGLKVELIKFTSGPAQFQALESGSIDLAQGALAAFYMASSRGLNAKWVYSYGNYGPLEGLIVAKDSKATSFADLKGKKVSAPSGSILHLANIAALRKANMNKDDVEFISLAPPQAVAALKNGDLEAAWFWEPFIDRSSKSGARMLFTNEASGVRDAFGIAANTKWLNKEGNVEVLASLYKAFVEGDTKFNENPDATLNEIQKITGIPKPLATRLVDGIHWYNLAEQTTAGSDVNLTDPLNKDNGAGQLLDWVEANAMWGGLMKTKGNPTEFLDSRAAAAALK